MQKREGVCVWVYVCVAADESMYNVRCTVVCVMDFLFFCSVLRFGL